MNNSVYDYLFITHLPSFYKVNLYNELSKQIKLYVVFIASSSSIRSSDFIGKDLCFDYEILYDGDFETRPKTYCAIKLLKTILRTNYNKLVVNGWDLLEFWIAVFTNCKAKNAIVVESTIIDSTTTGIKSKLKNIFVSRIATAFPSGRLHQQLLNSLGYDGISYLTGGVGIFDRKSYLHQKKKFTYSFLYVGRLSAEKNLIYLIDVFNYMSHLKLTIVGSGPMDLELKKIAKDNITFISHVPNHKIDRIYLDHDVFVLPSISEPWGLVVDEALHFGMPILISRNVGCHSELVEEGKTGYMFDPYDKNTLIEALKLVSDPETFHTLKNNVENTDFSRRDFDQIRAYIQASQKKCSMGQELENTFKIYVDCIVFNLQRVGGISIYFSELIQRLLSSEHDLSFIEQDKANVNIIRKELTIPENLIIKEKSIIYNINRYLPINVNLNKRSIVHSSYYRISNDKNAVNIITVYDYIYEYYRQGLAKYIHTLQKKNAIKKADGIICISESTRRDVLKYNRGIDPSKITVIYLSASKDFYPVDRSALNIKDNDIKHIINKQYILFVGARQYYKNFDLAIETVASLKEYIFVIAGGGPVTKTEFSKLHASLKDRYILVDSISSSNLNLLYNYASCLLYPSSYEGFGIPILEAMQAGCPVVTTSESSIPEVTGDAGLLVDKICIEAFEEKIRSLENPKFKSSVIIAGYQQANKFSWDMTYQKTIQFYNDIFTKKINR